jgi:hypothetical protein
LLLYLSHLPTPLKVLQPYSVFAKSFRPSVYCAEIASFFNYTFISLKKCNAALEPFFNAAASQFILGQQVPFTLWLSLAPVVIGNFWLFTPFFQLFVHHLGFFFLHSIFFINIDMV